jgi:hypothetical protein
VAEPAVRTLKTWRRWIRHFATVEDFRLRRVEFAAFDNATRLQGRQAHRTSDQIRAEQFSLATEAPRESNCQHGRSKSPLRNGAATRLCPVWKIFDARFYACRL